MGGEEIWDITFRKRDRIRRAEVWINDHPAWGLVITVLIILITFAALALTGKDNLYNPVLRGSGLILAERSPRVILPSLATDTFTFI